MLDGAEREVAAEHELGCVGSDSGTLEGDGSGCGTTAARQQRCTTAATAPTSEVCQHGDSDSSDGGGG